MKAKLVVVQGADAAEIPLRLPSVIGRSRQAGVKVRTSVVSREHCQLFDKNGKIFVSDLESANGTFVNDVKIDKPTLLGADDFLTVGPVTLQVVYEPVTNAQNTDASTTEDADESGVLAMVRYEETAEGSFLGIDDSRLGNIGDIGSELKPPEQKPEKPDSSSKKPTEKAANTKNSDSQTPAESINETDEPAGNVLFDATKIDADPIAPQDSALNKFFDELS